MEVIQIKASKDFGKYLQQCDNKFKLHTIISIEKLTSLIAVNELFIVVESGIILASNKLVKDVQPKARVGETNADVPITLVEDLPASSPPKSAPMANTPTSDIPPSTSNPMPPIDDTDDFLNIGDDWIGNDDVPESSSSEEVDDKELFRPLKRPNINEFVKTIANNRFQCTKCDQTSEFKQAILLHSQIHIEHSTVCKVCGLQLASPETLRNHEKKNCGIRVKRRKIRQCPYCEKNNFRNTLKFNDHQNFHKKESPYRCSCGSKFRGCNNFYAHRKKFQCPKEGCVYPDYAKHMGEEVRVNTVQSVRRVGDNIIFTASF